MLTIDRKPGQSLHIWLDDHVDRNSPIGEFFQQGPIEIQIQRILPQGVRLRLELDPRLQVLEAAWIGSENLTDEIITSPLRKQLKRKLRLLRLMHQWDMAALSRASGLSLTTVTAAEEGTGIIRIDDLDALAKAFSVPVRTLLDPSAQEEEQQVLAALLQL